MTACMICGRGLSDGIALFRQNPKGEVGIWACWQHSRALVDPEVKEIIDIVSDASHPDEKG